MPTMHRPKVESMLEAQNLFKFECRCPQWFGRHIKALIKDAVNLGKDTFTFSIPEKLTFDIGETIDLPQIKCDVPKRFICRIGDQAYLVMFVDLICAGDALFYFRAVSDLEAEDLLRNGLPPRQTEEYIEEEEPCE